MRSPLLLPGAVAGLIAGVVMAMFAMLVTAFSGQGLLAPPQMIAEPFFGPLRPDAVNAGRSSWD